MAGGRITGKTFSLAELFGDRTRYAIEYYQREYEWSADVVATLLSDLLEEFDRIDRVRKVWRGAPPQFFLGPFVYAEEQGGRRFLVDGQQRFTTLHLIFLHLLRLLPDGASRKTRARLDRAVVPDYRGDHPVFRLDIDERQLLLEALLDGRPYEIPLGASLSVQTLWRRSLQVEETLSQLDSDRYGSLVDWLLDSVVLVGIEAVDRDNGFRIFESMNDRGARLTSVDLIKSFLLSRARRDEEKLNGLWRDMLAEVTRRRGDADAPKEFLKAYLIAQHADLRDGSKDAVEIELAPHVWTRAHAQRIGLTEDGEPYLDFVTDLIALGRHYATLAAAMAQPRHDDGLAAVYYNHVNGITAQTALILAAVRPDDPLSVLREKARVAAGFVDLLYVSRIVHDESTRPEDLNAEVVALVPLVRGCGSAADLGTILGAHLPATDFAVMRTLGLRGDNRRQIHYLLARLTAYVEYEMGRPDTVEQYLSRERTWQIEHVFANHPERHAAEVDGLTFRLARNRIGGLGLLPASDNASVRDLPFADKFTWYRRHNALLAVLAPGYEQRNPALRRLRTSHGLDGALRGFRSSTPMMGVLDVRTDLYTRLARRLWDPVSLGFIAPSSEPPETPPPSVAPAATPSPTRVRAPRRGRRTELAALLADGRLRPGTHLHGIHRGTRHEARVDADGLLWLTDHDGFRLPDEAGCMATGLKRCQGWKFWQVTLVDGTAVPLGAFRDDPALMAG
ncbi:GmrSD restriction endonuclease domain-containing protein [Pseudonocardia sp. CA-142604]|uniref:GmrSD restriction endonuclease domain-containing protein n=1 Tax=Pseudonocardia sp. CA-142604 TaxID=3240024 RepID=UPI003D8EC6C4